MTLAKMRHLASACLAAAAMASAGAGPAAAQDNTDAGAGRWQMIVLSSPTQFPVAPPAQVSGVEYQAELAAVREAQARMTLADRKSIDYWRRGAVLRWSETMLEFVARADLPPPPRPDDTYGVPDAANPFAEPQFPFGNPPYAARAYSCVSVAQYDALKAAWYFKYLYNRPSPAKADSRVAAWVPATNLPAYPSEDAVVAGVSSVLLKLLFPTNAEEIDRKVAEHQRAALLMGKASESDLAAGFALGQAVAQVITQRAATDGMRTAGGPNAWPLMAAQATARGEVAWRSLEDPPRPPMLPLFGLVKAWMMTPDDILKERPGPPPSTSSPLMARELAEVESTVENLTRQQLAIAYKWNDGLSTPTPPGHWNVIAYPYLVEADFSDVRTARVLALLNMALHDAAVACWDAKFTYFNPRPSQLDPGIRTVMGLPNFPSYTSGHSTFSAAAAEVLSYVFPDGRAYFESQRDEAGISRLYGGIHYRSDIETGIEHGRRVGGYTVRFARLDGAAGDATPTSGPSRTGRGRGGRGGGR